MSAQGEWICHRCGCEDIFAIVEARGSVGGGIAVDGHGKPYFESDGRPDYDDVDEVGYECAGCGKNEFRLDKLVTTKRQAQDQLRKPCGRCDHDATDHPLADGGYRPEFTRPPMACSVEGCDCHDYYDRALGLEPNWGPPRQEALAV